MALPDAPLDDSAKAEAALIRAGQPYLHETWHGEHWRLYSVDGATPLGAHLEGPDGFSTRGGLVRVRWTPYWALLSGHGCVAKGPGSWTLVTPSAMAFWAPNGPELPNFDKRAVGADSAAAIERAPAKTEHLEIIGVARVHPHLEHGTIEIRNFWVK